MGSTGTKPRQKWPHSESSPKYLGRVSRHLCRSVSVPHTAGSAKPSRPAWARIRCSSWRMTVKECSAAGSSPRRRSAARTPNWSTTAFSSPASQRLPNPTAWWSQTTGSHPENPNWSPLMGGRVILSSLGSEAVGCSRSSTGAPAAVRALILRRRQGQAPHAKSPQQ